MGSSGEEQKPSPEDLAFAAALHLESDRGILLIGMTVLDEALENVLRAVMRADAPRAVESLFKFPMPFSSFTIKLTTAYALGLFDKQTYSDLKTLRRLRNRMAHSRTPVSFLDQPVRDAIESTACYARSKPEKLVIAPNPLYSKGHLKVRARVIVMLGWLSGWMDAMSAVAGVVGKAGLWAKIGEEADEARATPEEPQADSRTSDPV